MADQKSAAGAKTPALSETEKKVLEYIKKYKAQKYSDAEITKALEKSGIDQATIKKCMGLAKGKAPIYKNKWFWIGIAAVVILIILVLALSKPECRSDRDCDSGFTCQDKKCIEQILGCRSDSDCARGEECVRNECVSVEEEIVVEEEEEVEHVAECSTDEDCQSVYGSSYGCESGVCVSGGAEPQCGDGNCDIGESCALDCGCETDEECEEFGSYECDYGSCETVSSSSGGSSGSSGGGSESTTTTTTTVECDDSFDCEAGFYCSSNTCTNTECNDGSDNDADNLTDLDDGGCASLDDMSELYACSNYEDDDSDGYVDVFGGCDADADGDTDYICGCDLNSNGRFSSGEFMNVSSCDTTIYTYGCDITLDDGDYSYDTSYNCTESGQTYYDPDSDCDSARSEAEGGCTVDSDCRSGYVCSFDSACVEDTDGDGVGDRYEYECNDGDDNDTDNTTDYLGACDQDADGVADFNCLGIGITNPTVCRIYCSTNLSVDYILPDKNCFKLLWDTESDCVEDADCEEGYACGPGGICGTDADSDGIVDDYEVVCNNGDDDDADGEIDYLGACDTDGDTTTAEVNCRAEGILSPTVCQRHCVLNLTGTYIDADSVCTSVNGTSEEEAVTITEECSTNDDCEGLYGSGYGCIDGTCATTCVYTSWSTETVDTGNVGQYAELALVSTVPSITYTDDNTGDLKFATFDGTSWTTDAIYPETSGTTTIERNAIALDASGNAHVLAYDSTAAMLYYGIFDGSTWTFSEVAAGGQYNALVIDSSDTIHIAYKNDTDGLVHAYYDGSTWVTTDLESDAGKDIDMAIGEDGHIYITYVDDTFKYLQLADSADQTTWTTTTLASDGEAYSSVAVDSQGFVHVGYYSFDGELVYLYSEDAISWTETIVDTDGGTHASLALDGFGYPHIAYRDSADDAFNHAHYNGTEWTITTVDTSATGYYASLDVDEDNTVHIAYYDSANAELKYAAGTCEAAAVIAGPNLEIVDFSINSTTTATGTFNVTVANTGDTDITETFSTECTIYSPDDITDEYDGSRKEIAGLAAGAETSIVCSLEIVGHYDSLDTNDSTDTVTMFINVTVDSLGDVVESDETDNSYTYEEQWTAEDFGVEAEEAPYADATFCFTDSDCDSTANEVCVSFICYVAECSDGIDNDGDDPGDGSATDYGYDSDCTSATDNDESGTVEGLAYTPEVEINPVTSLWNTFKTFMTGGAQ